MSDIYESLVTGDSNSKIQAIKQFKLEFLAKLLAKLKQARDEFEQSKINLVQLKGGLLTFKDLLDGDDYGDISKKVDEILSDIYNDIDHVHLATNFNSKRVSLQSETTGLLRPSLTEIKDIACRIIKDLGYVENTSKLKEAFNKAGFDVNLNSLRTVLAQNKEQFNFDQKHGGWRLMQEELVPA